MCRLRLSCVCLAAAWLLCAATIWAAEDKPKEKEKESGKSLFDGKTLEGWKSTKFGGEGEVAVEEGQIVMPAGQEMTGITYSGKEELPKTNYELSYEAKRVEGSDFFAAATFPVKESYCSFVNGGWGGGVVGLSSIDGHDASENEYSKFKSFETGKWYKFKVRVTEEKIQCWIDAEQVIDADIKGKKITTRSEVNLNKPLGFSTWNTKGAIRNIRVAPLAEKK